MTRTGTLSAQLYSLRDQLAADQHSTLERLARLGFRYVEPFGLGSPDRPFTERLAAARSLRAGLDATGLTVSAVHAAVPPSITELAEECANIGADTVFVPHPKLVPGFDEQAFADVARVDAFADALSALAQEAAAHGLNVGYHNHWFEWAALPDGTSGYERFFSRASEDLLAELDIYWAAAAGVDPAGVLEMLGTRAVSVHVKDGPAEPGAPQTPIGTGTVDIPAALKSAENADWHVAEIDTTNVDPYELLSSNAEHLVGTGLSRWY
ncbi:sugar phosphate isomerase/epimerase [Salinifilum aidingensis]